MAMRGISENLVLRDIWRPTATPLLPRSLAGSATVTEAHERDVERLRGHGRVLLLFSHVQSPHGLNKEELFIRNVRRIGSRLQSRRLPGAPRYLYDLSPTR
jgi:hypothetical protein